MVGKSLFRDTFLLALGVSRIRFHFTITVIEGTFYKEGTFSNPECVLIGVFVSSVT